LEAPSTLRLQQLLDKENRHEDSKKIEQQKYSTTKDDMRKVTQIINQSA